MKTVKRNLNQYRKGVINSFYSKENMKEDQPKMKFEEIVARFKGKKYTPAAETVQKVSKVQIEIMKCTACGGDFEIRVYGPRHIRGACSCGGTTVMG